MERKAAAKKAMRMQRLMQFVIKHSLGGYSLSQKADVEFIPTRHGKIRVLKYGFDREEVLPVYFDMHGGGFIFMQADVDEKMNERFRQQAGVKVVSIDYPKAPQSPYPIPVEAVHDVIRYFMEHSDAYRICRNHIGIGGHSAGGNLATVTCINNLKTKEFDIGYEVLDYPPLDLATDPWQKPCPKGAISPKDAMMYNLCYVTPEQAKEVGASPVLASKQELTGMPKTLLIACGRDSLGDEGLRYAKLLRAAGVEVRSEYFPDSVHGFTYYKEDEAVRRAFHLMEEFIRENAHRDQ